VVKEIEKEVFAGVFCENNLSESFKGIDTVTVRKPYIPGQKVQIPSQDIFPMEKHCNSVNLESEPYEVIERRRYRELKEKFNRELFINAERVTSVAKPLIISLVTAFVIDLFYWILAFTPHAGYMWIIGNICTFIQIFSILGLLSLFFYSFFTGRRITLVYDRLFETFDKKLVSELD